jgi:hypothetical protein
MWQPRSKSIDSRADNVNTPNDKYQELSRLYDVHLTDAVGTKNYKWHARVCIVSDNAEVCEALFMNAQKLIQAYAFL